MSNHCFGTGQLGIHLGSHSSGWSKSCQLHCSPIRDPTLSLFTGPCIRPLTSAPQSPCVLWDQNHTVNTTSVSLIGYSAITVTQSGHQQIPSNQPGGRQPLLHSSAKPRNGLQSSSDQQGKYYCSSTFRNFVRTLKISHCYYKYRKMKNSKTNIHSLCCDKTLKTLRIKVLYFFI